MAMNEKLGYVRCENIMFRDYNEYINFLSKLLRDFKDHIIMLDGKKVIGEGPFKMVTPEQMESLKALKMNITTNEKKNSMSIVGYGNRSYVWGVEGMIRSLYDANIVVTYDVSDTISDSNHFGPTLEEIDRYNAEFEEEKAKRIELFAKGEFPPVITEKEIEAHTYKI